MKRLSWKYIAGLIDGEGCIDFQTVRHRHKRADGEAVEYFSIAPRVRVSLSEPGHGVLEMLHANHGGSLDERKKSDNPSWSQAVTWNLGNRKARPFLQNIQNHLVIKQQQARFAIWVIDHLLGKRADGAGMGNLADARQRAILEMKAMKRDPQRLSERAASEVMKILGG